MSEVKLDFAGIGPSRRLSKNVTALLRVQRSITSSSNAIKNFIPIGGTSSGNGGIADSSGSLSWPSFAALYEEFRIKKVKIWICSIGGTTTVDLPGLAVAFDEKVVASSALASPGLVLVYDSVRLVPANIDTNFGFKSFGWALAGSSKKNSQFPINYTLTSSPANHPGTVFINGLDGTTTATVTTHTCVVEYEVDFRNRG
jgi:hypothetical protein